MEGFWVALGVVFVAELGDKTQLVVLTMGARHRLAAALVGLFVTSAVLMGIAATVGAALGSLVSPRVTGLAAGLLFLGFAVWTWRAQPGAGEEPTEDRSATGVASLMGAFFLAELGDKTQLTAASIAADRGALGAWIGATFGLFGATVLALVAGRFLRERISPRWLARAGAVAFAIVGVVTLAGAAFG